MAFQDGDPGGEYYFSLGVNAPGAWSATNFASLVNNAPAGRSTTYAIQVSNSNGYVEKVLSGNFASEWHGGAFYVGAGPFTPGTIILAAYDGATTQCDIRVDANGHIYATRNGVQLGSASVQAFVANQGWVFPEWNPTINAATGAIAVWVNGVQWLNLTAQNTQNSANAYMNKLRYGGQVGTTASYWKDMYWLDTGTGVDTTRLGDVMVGVGYLNAAGVNQAWTNNGGASQTASVQDGITHTGTWPDGDATYISSSTANQISDFAHQTLVLTGSILAVVHKTYARKDDAGSRTISQVCLSGATTELSPSISLGNSYQYYTDVLENDPNTSAPWTVANYNAATFGVKELT